MLRSITVRKPFSIKNDLLTKDYINNIKQHVVDTIIDTCDKEYGYIFKLDEIEDVGDIIMSRANNNCIVRPLLHLTCFKPVVGDVVKGNVNTLFEQGIFVTVYALVKCFISSEEVEKAGYRITHDDSGIIAIHVDTSATIEKGDDIDIRFVATQYDKGGYNCIAELV